MDACVFCGLISADSARWIAKEDAAVAFLPLPGEEIAPGHTLVVPRRHTTAGLLDAQPADLTLVMDLAQRILREDPFREDIHCMIMRAQAALGNRVAVKEQYEILHELLQKELGVEPAMQTQKSYRELMGN